MVMPNGRVRDTVVFSILKNEWPVVNQNLEYKLDWPALQKFRQPFWSGRRESVPSYCYLAPGMISSTK